MHHFLTPFFNLANDAGDKYLVMHESKDRHVLVTGHKGIDKGDVMEFIQHLVNAYRLTDVQLEGLECERTKTLSENY